MRILFAAIGSLGDLYPCLALAKELKRRGHLVSIASTEAYRPRVIALGLGFHSLRPNWDPADSELIGQCEDLKRGPEILFRKLILPHLAETYSDLLAAAQGIDIMLAGELVYAGPLVAEKLQLRWASLILSPCSFLSVYDPSLLVNVPGFYRIRKAGWRINKAALTMGVYFTRHWWEPVKQLRIREGLKKDCAPLTKDKFSPDLVLAMFPNVLAHPQPDWPAQTIQTGFAFYDEAEEKETDEKPGFEGLNDFLAAGGAPIVFTLGSTAVAHPGNFYEASAEAAIRLGQRAILIGAPDLELASSQIFVASYAPYADVFGRASIVVHQGGSGTTGQVMRAGKPMLFVPFGWDQPDNGARVKRLGAGLVVPRAEYTAKTASFAIDKLLKEEHFAERAAELGSEVRQQNGVQAACDAIDALARRIADGH